LYGYYSDRENNYLVFAHSGKSLESVCPIHAQNGESKMRRIVKIAFQISNAMIYLEKNNIVHRDLTAGNVLIDDYGFIRIADFGHAIQKEQGKNNLSRSLTHNGEDRFQIRFLAPECIPKPLPQTQTKQPTNNDRRQLYASFSSKSDVWSFGILLIQLMITNPLKPYPHIDKDFDIPQHIKINREMHPKPHDCLIDIYYILQQCWAYEPINRISFIDIRKKMNMLDSIVR
jgi:serine/threonine protein kinase